MPQKRKTTSVLDQSLDHVIAVSFLGVSDRRGKVTHLEYLFTVTKFNINHSGEDHF